MHLIITDRTKIIYSMYKAGPYTEHAASGLPNPTLLWGGGRYDLSRQMLPHSPRMVAECLVTRSMLIKMYYHFMVYAYTCTIVFTVSQFLRFQTSFRMEGHTVWEVAPPSYDLQS